MLRYSVSYAFLLPSNSASRVIKRIFYDLRTVLTQPDTQKVPVAWKGYKLWRPGQASVDVVQIRDVCRAALLLSHQSATVAGMLRLRLRRVAALLWMKMPTILYHASLAENSRECCSHFKYGLSACCGCFGDESLSFVSEELLLEYLNLTPPPLSEVTSTHDTSS